MSTEHKAILEKAKRTKYKHSMWSLEHMGIDTVYGFMNWAANEGSSYFYLELKPSLKYIEDMPEIETELKKRNELRQGIQRSDILDMCIELGLYKYIRLVSHERSSDQGMLKIQTYLILKGLI